jgi:hypothetical protein
MDEPDYLTFIRSLYGDLSQDVLYIVPREYRTHSELFIDSSQIDIGVNCSLWGS